MAHATSCIGAALWRLMRAAVGKPHSRSELGKYGKKKEPSLGRRRESARLCDVGPLVEDMPSCFVGPGGHIDITTTLSHTMQNAAQAKCSVNGKAGELR